MAGDADVQPRGTDPSAARNSSDRPDARYPRNPAESKPPEASNPPGGPSDTQADDRVWIAEDDEIESEVSSADIQEAYLKALAAMESIEWPIELRDENEQEHPENGSNALHSPPVPTGGTPASVDLDLTSITTAAIEAGSPLDVPAAGSREQTPRSSIAANGQSWPPAGLTPPVAPPPASSPARIIEAILFVGGNSMTAKRLCAVLGGTVDHDYVEQRIDDLNAEYSSQGRPYEIRLGEGGYRLALRPEYESVRNKVYGAGPREVRLSQDALELLALVAYQQPISQADVEGCGKKNAGNLLRQLIRRELIAINRMDSTRAGIRYQTTPRFLSLFGLAGLDELPKADELNMR